jgi:hypothetical protein
MNPHTKRRVYCFECDEDSLVFKADSFDVTVYSFILTPDSRPEMYPSSFKTNPMSHFMNPQQRLLNTCVNMAFHVPYSLFFVRDPFVFVADMSK